MGLPSSSTGGGSDDRGAAAARAPPPPDRSAKIWATKSATLSVAQRPRTIGRHRRMDLLLQCRGSASLPLGEECGPGQSRRFRSAFEVGAVAARAKLGIRRLAASDLRLRSGGPEQQERKRKTTDAHVRNEHIAGDGAPRYCPAFISIFSMGEPSSARTSTFAVLPSTEIETKCSVLITFLVMTGSGLPTS